ncbi:MAG: hypothetical protein HY097_06290 [Nitrospinae bacterium]|nr:hypothetical protein [Nitrospinota bacterium]MBI3813067.1 hypothetical protein [Nitrospinota bacterium]
MKSRDPSISSTGAFNPETLSHFDGKDGQPAFIAYKEKVYDVSNNKLWKSGIHMKHKAGMDMTSALSMAPHGEEKLSSLPVIGSFNPHAKSSLNFYQKAFYFVAYMNLSLVFLTLFIIALWRWWA